MRKGGGHSKGADFERTVAKALSLWASDGMQADVFWRTPGSGSRHTAGGDETAAHAGDICATHEIGRPFCRHLLIECKAYKRWDWRGFLFERRGELYQFWAKLHSQALEADRLPLLIAKENGRTTLIVTTPLGAELLLGSSNVLHLSGGMAVEPLTTLLARVYLDVIEAINSHYYWKAQRAVS